MAVGESETTHVGLVVVVAVVDGEFTVKQLLHTARGTVLRAAHPDYPEIAVTAGHDFSVWGVVQWNVHRL